MQPIFASLWWWRSPMIQKTATLTSICFSSIDGVNKSSHGSLDKMILSHATFAAATTVAISLLRPLSCKHACDIDNYFYSRRDAIVGNQISREEWRVRQNDNCKVQYTDLGRCRLTIVTISNKDNVHEWNPYAVIILSKCLCADDEVHFYPKLCSFLRLSFSHCLHSHSPHSPTWDVDKEEGVFLHTESPQY